MGSEELKLFYKTINYDLKMNRITVPKLLYNIKSFNVSKVGE